MRISDLIAKGNGFKEDAYGEEHASSVWKQILPHRLSKCEFDSEPHLAILGKQIFHWKEGLWQYIDSDFQGRVQK
jgi:hypothetical protein